MRQSGWREEGRRGRMKWFSFFLPLINPQSVWFERKICLRRKIHRVKETDEGQIGSKGVKKRTKKGWSASPSHTHTHTRATVEGLMRQRKHICASRLLDYQERRNSSCALKLREVIIFAEKSRQFDVTEVIRTCNFCLCVLRQRKNIRHLSKRKFKSPADSGSLYFSRPWNRLRLSVKVTTEEEIWKEVFFPLYFLKRVNNLRF